MRGSSGVEPPPKAFFPWKPTVQCIEVAWSNVLNNETDFDALVHQS